MNRFLIGLIGFTAGVWISAELAGKTTKYELGRQAVELKQECEQTLPRDRFCVMQFVDR